MSTKRTSAGGWVWNPDKLPKGPNGRPLCRRCSAEIPEGRRRTFCSTACVHEWKMRTDPSYVRRQVYERDKGVCGRCTVDTMANSSRKRAQGSGHLWQADHVIPVVEGGGECGLENLQTLCTACHKIETAALAARRAEARRNSSQLSLVGVGSASLSIAEQESPSGDVTTESVMLR